MERKEKKMRFIYEDDGETKCVSGYLLRNDDFTFDIEALNSGEKITIGKRGLIKASEIK